MKKQENQNDIVIYKAKDGRTSLEVNLAQDTVWLNQTQIMALFQRDQSVISRHIRNLFSEGELEQESNMQKMHIADSAKPVILYSLDVIISVGYRVKSKQGTQFRIWATQVLKEHLLRGYTVNEKRLLAQNARLQELQKTVELMGRLLENHDLQKDQATGLLKVITDYALALRLLDQYDHQRLTFQGTTTTPAYILTYEMAMDGIAKLGRQDGARGSLFGREKDASFRSCTL